MGASWKVTRVVDQISHRSSTLRYNRSEVTLRASAGRPDARWDGGGGCAPCVPKRISVSPRATLRAAQGARFVASGHGAGDPDTRAITIPTDGTPMRYALIGGAARSVKEALRAYGATDPYEEVELTIPLRERRGVPDAARVAVHLDALCERGGHDARESDAAPRSTIATMGPSRSGCRPARRVPSYGFNGARPEGVTTGQRFSTAAPAKPANQ